MWIPRQPVDLVEDFERVSKGALLLRGVTAAAPRKTHDTQKIKVKSRECARTGGDGKRERRGGRESRGGGGRGEIEDMGE